jgi:hypothetical protein
MIEGLYAFKAEINVFLGIMEEEFHELCVSIALASLNLRMKRTSAYKERIAFSITCSTKRHVLKGRYRWQEKGLSLRIMKHFAVFRIEKHTDGKKLWNKF